MLFLAKSDDISYQLLQLQDLTSQHIQPDSILGLWNEIGYCAFDPSLFGTNPRIMIWNGWW